MSGLETHFASYEIILLRTLSIESSVLPKRQSGAQVFLWKFFAGGLLPPPAGKTVMVRAT